MKPVRAVHMKGAASNQQLRHFTALTVSQDQTTTPDTQHTLTPNPLCHVGVLSAFRSVVSIMSSCSKRASVVQFLT